MIARHILPLTISLLDSSLCTREGSPPFLLASSKLSQVEVLEGKSKSLKCPVAGSVMTFYRWFREHESDEDEIYSSNSEYKLSGNGNRRLTVKRIGRECEGLYRCRAVNGFGTQEHIFHLKVVTEQS